MLVFGVFSPTVCSFNISQARPSYSAITNIPQPSHAPSNKVLAFHTVHDSLSGGAAHCGGSRHCLQRLLPGHGMCIIPFSIAVPNTFKDITGGNCFQGARDKALAFSMWGFSIQSRNQRWIYNFSKTSQVSFSVGNPVLLMNEWKNAQLLIPSLY